MNRHGGLLTRLRRLEARHKARKPMPTIIMGVYAEERPGSIIGFEGDGRGVNLKAGETLEALRARAVAEIPARILQTLYSAATDAPERQAEPSRVRTPANEPEGAPRAAPAVPAVPGVGRRATQSELIRMGAIPVPAERLV